MKVKAVEYNEKEREVKFELDNELYSLIAEISRISGRTVEEEFQDIVNKSMEALRNGR